MRYIDIVLAIDKASYVQASYQRSIGILQVDNQLGRIIANIAEIGFFLFKTDNFTLAIEGSEN